MQVKISVDGKAALYYGLLSLDGQDREGRIAITAIRKALELTEDERKEIGLEERMTADGEVVGALWRRRCAAALALVEVTLERDQAKRLMTILDKWGGFRQIDHEYFAEDLYRELKAAL